jgi:hypothetical protein
LLFLLVFPLPLIFIYYYLQEPYTQLAAATAFVAKLTPQLDALRKEAIEKKFSKQANGKMEYVTTLIGVASQLSLNSLDRLSIKLKKPETCWLFSNRFVYFHI